MQGSLRTNRRHLRIKYMKPSFFIPDNNKILVAGIINLSPESFYEDSRCDTVVSAVKKAERMMAEGADFLDIGAESSRPSSRSIPTEVELERLLPVVTQLRKTGIPLSVDTYKPFVAERVLDLGVGLINDITGLQRDHAMAGVIARFNAGVIIMHMRGTPETMQIDPRYDDLIGEIIQFFQNSIAIAESAGIASMILDPGIGFGKTVEHNLELLRCLGRFKILGKPILVGASRKGFIGQVLDLPVEERLEGSLASAVVAVTNGARILRVHDVKETVRAVKTAQAIIYPEREKR